MSPFNMLASRGDRPAGTGGGVAEGVDVGLGVEIGVGPGAGDELPQPTAAAIRAARKAAPCEALALIRMRLTRQR
jgi:hypothetical protein